ncbi:MAG TPA: RNA 2',3'-cyclic phosphodiesterase [Candidatus Dormibacteraeota bacterium]
MTRAFVAVAPPEAVAAELGGYLERCRNVAPTFRWVAPAGVHLTLRFLGSVEEPVLASVTAGLRRIRRPSFELRLGGLGTFGGRRPSVIWLGLAEGAAAAKELAREVESACLAAGLAPETRPFRPHLTLARARDRFGSPVPELPPAPELPAWTATEMVLYESRLGGGPPVYTPLERFPLEAERS